MSQRTKNERLRRNVAEARMNAWKRLMMRDGAVPLFAISAVQNEAGVSQPMLYSLHLSSETVVKILRQMADHLEKQNGG